MAIVKWYFKDNPEKKGQGEPVEIESAKAAVAIGNRDYPYIFHYYEII